MPDGAASALAYMAVERAAVALRPMDMGEALAQVPRVAEAVREARGSAGPHWTLHMREPGEDDWQPVPLTTGPQSRSAAIALSELGYQVCVQDDKGCIRLRMWPPARD